MKVANIATFLVIAASTSSIGSAFERRLDDDDRRLRMGYYGDASSKFDKYYDIYKRCCAPKASVLESDASECKCPVRTFNKWGFDIYSKWNDKCESRIKEKSDIIALAQAKGFDELVNLLVPDRLDLVDVLKSDNDGNGWTVFAPTNDAFEALPDSCSSLTSEEITSLLLYHVVPGTFTSDRLVEESIKTAPTALENQSLDITITDAGVMIDAGVMLDAGVNGDAKVIAANVTASNGVAHAIDKVLIPPGFCE